MDGLLKCTQSGHTAFVLINLPRIDQGFGNMFLDELCLTMEKLDRQREIYAVILAGTGRLYGENVSGEDSSSFGSGRISSSASSQGIRCADMIASMRAYTIAAVNGLVSGDLCDIVLSCKARVGTENTSFSFPVPISNINWIISTLHLPDDERYDAIGKLISSARRVNMRMAVECGLIDEISDSRELIDRCIEMASDVISISR